MKGGPSRSSRAEEFWRHFPALKPLAAVLRFTVRLTGAIFGLIFSAGPAYVFWKYVFPALLDPVLPAEKRLAAALFGILLFFFFVVGLFILYGVVREKGLPTPTTKPALPAREEMVRLAKQTRKTAVVGLKRTKDGRLLLSSANVYRTLAIFLAVFAAIWNGIIALGWRDFRGFDHWISFLHLAFMTPFLCVGIGLLYVLAKLLFSLRQPVVEVSLPKSEYGRGEEVRAEIRLRDPKRRTKRFRAILRKRGLVPSDDDPVLKTSELIDERLLVELEASELDLDWTTTLSFRLDADAEEWSEWALEIEVTSDQPLPLYLAFPLHFELASDAA